MCLQGWVFAHFRNLLLRISNDDYDPVIAPLVTQWKPTRGLTDPGHYKDAIDSLDHSHVIWRPYERQRHITPFQDICWCSGWIMAGKDRRVRHLPERVLRQYGYVKTIPKPPSDIGRLAVDDVVMAFLEFALHVLSQQDRGGPVSDKESWAHSRGYMRWFIRVSHPIVKPLRPFLTTQLMPLLVLSLLTRRFLWSSSGPNILPTHTK